ncbi:Rna polymerase ii-associated protein 3 [Rhizoctonia solani]|uniref:Rna polymerase ii-associated protein 3 n=1 Tax=Rhizoctonia solani TaxID=456999 RepID=A0A8H7IEZ1_9AGAM|nr:Rna polymerase ii-associated protein 3 [Rhizoctonia solani]
MAAAEHKEKAPGDYPVAIGHYTSAILVDGTDPTFPLNRAAAYLKLNKNEDAERDCTLVLKLQENNVKALFRRAQARVALGKLQDARADLVAAAKAEPGNAVVRTEFTKVEALISEAAKKAKTGNGTPISLPTRAPATSESSETPYRRRVPIGIVDDDAPEKGENDEAAKSKATSTVASLKSILKNTSPSLSDHQATTPPTTPKADNLLTPVSTRTLPSSEVSSQKNPTPPSSVSNRNPTQPSPPPLTEPPTPPSLPTTSAPSSNALTTPSEPPTKRTPTNHLQHSPPTRLDTSRTLGIPAEMTVPPVSIPTLFGPTLESPLLGTPILDSCSFLDAAEKKSAKNVWNLLEKSGLGVDLEKEKKKWGC